MNWYKLFYFMSLADRLQAFFRIFAWINTVIACIAMICWLVGLFEDDKDMKRVSSKWVFLFWPVMITMWFCWVATPSKKDAILIIAGGVVGQFVSNDSSARALPSDITRFLRVKILEETQKIDLKEELFPEKDTLKNKSKEELYKILKDMKR